MKGRIWILLGLVLAACAPAPESGEGDFPVPAIEFAPRKYFCPRAETPPVIDGKIDDAAWGAFGCNWTEDFGDITGDAAKPPRFRTRAKLVWDDEYLYVAAEMEEPHVWGTLTERDCVIYHDNDIELFLDPDGDTHEYYEFEMNALNTLWDLLVTKPYRDEGHGINAWDARGIRTAVHVDGTLSDPSDEDRGWSIEMAIPWNPIRESERKAGPPAIGDEWRMNMSRVEWRAKVVDGKYVKETDPKTGKPLHEDNWCWSPQGLVAMHMPEMWGRLKFVEGAHAEIGIGAGGPDHTWVLRRVYYAQKKHHARHGKFAKTLGPLDLGKLGCEVSLEATDNQFIATARDTIGATVNPDLARIRFTIDQEGRLRRREEDSE